MFRRTVATTLAQSVRAFSTSVAGQGAVRAGVLLQRDPIVIQQAKGFELASDKYFQWLEYQSAEAFPRDFFLKKGSSAEKKWMDIEDERAGEWLYDPENKPKVKSVKKPVVGDEETGPEVSKRIEVHSRETEADATGDVRSLERKLDRTLYLLVKNTQGEWVLPAGAVQGEELLHEAARRNLKEMCGEKMSVWMVGRGPVGHEESKDGATFFVKGHILAGQAAPSKSLAADFKWATREEVEGTVAPAYWQSVKDMLSSV
ncbi:hypothetical protein EC988_002420 [Linderina pennispora]|nr:hypothetical protein EC988_002420 [Linderina pennispora]